MPPSCVASEPNLPYDASLLPLKRLPANVSILPEIRRFHASNASVELVNGTYRLSSLAVNWGVQSFTYADYLDLSLAKVWSRRAILPGTAHAHDCNHTVDNCILELGNVLHADGTQMVTRSLLKLPPCEFRKDQIVTIVIRHKIRMTVIQSKVIGIISFIFPLCGTRLPTVQAQAKTQQGSQWLTGTKYVGKAQAGIRSESESESGGESASESDLDCTKWGKMSEWSKINPNETQQGQGAEGM
ncbi:hypothetical protein B0H14DRAFT_2568509 [Mycena olivaceomarginata]|nr:hypothetical protein B0H14DRAFT_2568509 [Mycena olivaceomarginata]